ncbi:hypothetical protein K450DRAFT_225226 [Umbelopsis ramanniana AG]|uniref:Histone acetyltransferases subunit 3-domain-containing protein n=1 Tax=Umbelopsis ramanniana AG TaxID=1314678 RepID=A0AAD5EFD8_UMBRA|nr:uncharacterized protein K450DRAFT_225226 [Umbelopsis ramanniana AG]KAI8582868.1 hypothetical protein K450DRAFT_225226 [Umbelopsis ramanniana AG]
MPEEHPSRIAFTQYTSPITAVKSAAPSVHQLAISRNANSVSSTIPSAKELQKIKLELERLLPTSEARIKQLRSDLHAIEKSTRARKGGKQSKGKHMADRHARSKGSESDKVRQDRDRDRETRRDSSTEQEQDKGNKKRLPNQIRSSSLAREKSTGDREKSASTDEVDSDAGHSKNQESYSEDEIDIKKESTGHDIKEESPNSPNLSSPSKKRKWNEDSAGADDKIHGLSRAKSQRENSPSQSLLSSTLLKNAERTSELKEHRSASASVHENNIAKSIVSTPGRGTPPVKVQERAQSAPVNAHRLDADPNYLQKMRKKESGKPKYSEPDFVRVKAKDQVPIQNFWAAVEGYFNPLTEEDRRFLMAKEDDPDFHVIPPLGRHYLETWVENEQSLVPSLNSPRSPAYFSPSRHNIRDLHLDRNEQFHYIYPEKSLTDQQLLFEDLSCGALTERLISSMIKEDPAPDTLESAEVDDSSTEGGQNDTFDNIDDLDGESWSDITEHQPEELTQFEEKLQRELRYIGLLGDDEFDLSNREDDEVCAELRKLSRELKEQLKLNNERKARLAAVVEKQLQFEQYQQVLDMLDSQVDQIYVKHHRAQKSKSKRKLTTAMKNLPEGGSWAIQRRKLWVDSIGAIFRNRSIIMPEESIYTGLPASISDEKPIDIANRILDSGNSKSSSQTPKPIK